MVLWKKQESVEAFTTLEETILPCPIKLCIEKIQVT